MKKKFQEYLTYLSPEFIYIPFDKMELLKIKSSKIVLNNTFLGNMEDGRNIFSPVSGKILGIKEMQFNGKKSNCLVVEISFSFLSKQIFFAIFLENLSSPYSYIIFASCSSS